MSTATVITPMSLPLITRHIRGFFAPVDRTRNSPTIFDPSTYSNWDTSAPAVPWVDLGSIADFTRSAESKITEVNTGVPATVRLQVRQTLAATVSFRFMTWSKLSMALATSSQHMNLLMPAALSPAIGSGAKAVPAVSLQEGSSATSLYLAGSSSSTVQVGSLVVVDDDYVTQTGFVGAGVSAGYVKSASSANNDLDYIRRVSFNVSRVIAISGDASLQLAKPLLAGAPTSSMKMQQISGFVDREGGSFFQEWSALFVLEGVQGEKLLYHYPRLQACESATESSTQFASSLTLIQLNAKFRALPVIDGNDGEQILCYRSFLPGNVTYV